MKTYRITQEVPSYSKRNGGGMKRIVVAKNIDTIDEATKKAIELFPKIQSFSKNGHKLTASFLGLFGRTYIHIL